MLNYEFPPLGGGAGNATYYLLKEFSKYPELEIDLITSSVDNFRVEKFASNITIHYLDINKRGNLHYQSNKDLLLYSFKTYFYAKKLIKGKRFDLCHAFFGIPCGYLAMKLKLPYAASLRGSDVPFYNKRFYLLDKLIFKKLSVKVWRNAEKVIANSQGLKDLALKANPSQRIEVIYNGIDAKEFKPDLAKKMGETIKLISVGRLIPRKGYDYLIKALEGLSGFELTLIGDGDQKEYLEKLAKRKGVGVNFLGKIEHNLIRDYLKKADIFILPSLNEGMPNAILEAMASGLAIIATDTGGSAELIQGNGFVIEKGNVGQIQESLIKFLENKEQMRLMGNRSREIAENLSWPKGASKYTEIYNELA